MQWIEAILNISALVGFVGVANLGCQSRDQGAPEEPIG
jgi:hypothetical protein